MTTNTCELLLSRTEKDTESKRNGYGHSTKGQGEGDRKETSDGVHLLDEGEGGEGGVAVDHLVQDAAQAPYI